MRNENYVIFGAAVLGEKAYAICKSLNKEVLAFVDNDKGKQGTKKLGLDVISCEELTEVDTDRSNMVILCVRDDKGRDSIRTQLSQVGYPTANIQNYDQLFEERLAFEKEEFEKEHPYVLKNTRVRGGNAAAICKEFATEGIAVIERNIDQKDFMDWKNDIGYETNYHKYVEIFGAAIDKKIFQHYMSLRLLEIEPDRTLVDIASSVSVFPDIVKKEYSDFVYRQDISYEKGVHGDKIGSFASDIPLEDSSVDYMTLHCSFEHFEGNEDIDFILKAGKILKPGGKVCIIPLYMAEKYYIWTSPEVWLSKYDAYDTRPDLDPEAMIVYENKIKQRQSRHYDVKALKKRILNRAEHLFSIRVYFLTNYAQIKGACPFAMILQKK